MLREGMERGPIEYDNVKEADVISAVIPLAYNSFCRAATEWAQMGNVLGGHRSRQTIDYAIVAATPGIHILE